MDNLPVMLTNKQCAELLKPALRSNIVAARGNSRRYMTFYYFQALARAIILLENTPDNNSLNKLTPL